ncbi:SpoIIE family protein phosphatase [Planotetraspora sp. A-T 1434]|uniref:PP2C family protein-serine/threonine phosphatase n=1 Tax=Planotetraspora sp. A-T 1434 TaxID=2979219 RepID=UPI0021C0F1A5|nr:SpoIIE family protein phosphatase [Planotetraspora sp. A-T 1434]MCT9931782.1 SpoIIE family protein phosphatase [Planotetraspora sp. A-T 1434]
MSDAVMTDAVMTDPAIADAVTDVQAMLDVISVQAVWCVPIRNGLGDITDFEVRAASPDAIDVHGRSGKELIGVRTLAMYPSVLDTPLWQSYLRVMRTGEPEEVIRYEHMEAVRGIPHRSIYTVKASRLRDGLLQVWTRHDDEERLAARQAHTERLGSLGWGRWDFVTGEAEWSPQLYLIHGRDPADGPLELEGYRAITHPDDYSVVENAVAELTTADGPYEFEFRIRVGGAYRYIRATAELSRDATGRPIEMHGVLQDVTDWRRTADQLMTVRQRLEEESQLTSHLQHIIMPVQDEPVVLPGMRVAARYDPAETAPLGGDWYQAIALNDDEVLLAIGDVAGHGVAAASAMAKLRHAITGLAFAHHDPAETLVALNRLLRRMRPDVLATAIVARYQPRSRTLTWTHAGHPPMLLVRGDKVRRLLHPGVLLGVFDEVAYTTASVRLEPGDLLLMFTDGLIELPGRDLFDGLDILSSTIEETMRTAPGDPLTAVTDVLTPSNTSDDTCILVARITPNNLEVS